ncbi:hypothetical protein GCM10011410_29000 [Hoyosella rhizosphaerae]|uniref:DUF4333 domain-containing protein n=1 Tax=Hoyosella rhizosphaerae TaxID=1755582 RepID=A0A916XJ10_9ACTN|nr:hypothetical protein GCM10011410_29000 [Hoyosella rhizosphaerae]
MLLCAVGFGAVSLAAAGCSSELYVERDEVEATIGDVVGEQIGEELNDVTCPEDLPGELEATMRCTVVDSVGSEYEVWVSVTGVEGRTVDYNLDQGTILLLGRAEVERVLHESVDDVALEAVSCEGDLPATVGELQRCSFADPDGETRQVDAEVVAVDGVVATLDFTLLE